MAIRRAGSRRGLAGFHLASAVHVLAVPNLDDGDDQLIVQNLIDDALLADADAPEVLGVRELDASLSARVAAERDEHRSNHLHAGQAAIGRSGSNDEDVTHNARM